MPTEKKPPDELIAEDIRLVVDDQVPEGDVSPPAESNKQANESAQPVPAVRTVRESDPPLQVFSDGEEHHFVDTRLDPKPRDKRVAHAVLRTVAAAPILLVLVGMFLSFVDHLSRQGTHPNPQVFDFMLQAMGPAIQLTALATIVALALSWRSEPKAVALKFHGLVIGRRGDAYGRTVRWDQIEKVAVSESKFLGLVREKLLIITTTEGKRLRIRWDDVAASVDTTALFTALRARAPEAMVGIERESAGSDTEYTDLWFKYFSTPAQRERVTHLLGGVSLRGGQYRVVGQLGGGGQGTAYLAIHEERGSAGEGRPAEVVLKEYVLPVHRGNVVLDHTIERLNREAAILERIDHPGIVRCYDCFIEDHRGYLVMEYVEGKSLKDLVTCQGKLPEETVRELGLQMCSMLHYLHCMSPPVVHRDFTPDNLILQDDGKLRLVDFNVAHQLESSATATVVGKHAYIPPEQFRGRPVPQSDLYALGCTLFYLLTGCEPEPISVSRPQAHVASISPAMDAIVARLTSLEPARRYRDAASLEGELKDLKA